MFMGAKVFNELPLELCKIENYKEFEKQLKNHLKITPFLFLNLCFYFVRFIYNCKYW